MKLVMFDIDGTLTRTDEADEACFVQALGDIFHFADVDTDWAVYPHCSDSGILEVLFQTRVGRSPLPAELSVFQAHFLSLLVCATSAQPFGEVAGAGDFLNKLRKLPDTAVCLASGAWEASARFKLVSAGLDLRQIPAAFSDDAHAREEIMRVSLARAARFHGREAFETIIYVGDGVWDARAARNLGFPFVGIAHDPARVARLYAEGALHVFSDYLDADAVLSALFQINYVG